MIRNTAKTREADETDLATVFSSRQQNSNAPRLPWRAIRQRAPCIGPGSPRVACVRCSELSVSAKERIEIRRYRRDLRSLALELATVRQADVMREEMLDTLAKLSNGKVPARRKIGVLLDQECALARRQLQEHTHSRGVEGAPGKTATLAAAVHARLGQMRDQHSVARNMIVNSAQAFWRARRRGNGSARNLHKVRIHAKSHRYVVDALAPLVGSKHASSVLPRARYNMASVDISMRELPASGYPLISDPVSKSLAKDASARLRKRGRKVPQGSQARVAFVVRLSQPIITPSRGRSARSRAPRRCRSTPSARHCATHFCP